jgi:2-phospho-L-lactate guanylyltransferase
MDASGGGWAIVVPVKRLAVAKSRLAVSPDLRRELALRMAIDTVSALLAVATVRIVVVVTDQTDAAAAMRRIGAVVVPDAPDAGLNPALRHGAAAAPPDVLGVAAVAADLPALRSAEMAGLLDRAATHPSAVVADATGRGSTVYAVTQPAAFDPRFGPGSFAAHVATGAADLTTWAGPSLRCDVDTLEDLAAAAALGCGTATTDALSRFDVLPPDPT